MRTTLKYFYPSLFIAVLAFLQIFFFLYADIKLLLDLIPDDAAYYFKIAENFSAGLGFTFDTIHQTNGFQPLWQYILIVIYKVFPVGHENFYRMVLVFQTLMISISAHLIFYSIRRNSNQQNAVISLSVFMLLVFMQAANGMESALVVFTLTISYLYFNQELTNKKYFIAGVLTAILLLSRLDFLFLPGILFIIFVIRREWGGILTYYFGFLVIFLPYPLINYFYTGYSGPISGVLKSGFPQIIFNFDLQYTLTGFITIFGALAAAILYIIFNSKMVVNKDLKYRTLFLYTIAWTILIHYTFYVLFIKWPVLNYYFFFYGVFLAIVSAEFLKLKISPLIGAILLSGVMLFIVIKDITRLNKDIESSWHVQAYNAAVWAKYNTPPDAVFAMKDAGNFSFISQRRVINLDGLVNDYKYQDFLHEKRLNQYFKLNKVSYYVLYEARADEDLLIGNYQLYKESFMSYMYMKQSDSIIIGQGKEVYRKIFANNSAFIIWELD